NHHILGPQKGRYRSFIGLLKLFDKDEEGKLHFQKDKAVNLAKTFLRLIPFSSKFIKLGGNISELDRTNIDMFIRETQMLLNLSMATAFIKMKASDDEDDDTKGFLKYL